MQRLWLSLEQPRVQLIETLHDALMADIGKGLLRQADEYARFNAPGAKLTLHVGQYISVTGGAAWLIHCLRAHAVPYG